MDTREICERAVEVETAPVAGFGFIAVGIVRRGLGPEVGMRFEAKGADAAEARRNLESEIEAYFS